MDARDLLNSWPGFDQMTPAKILAHPAWKQTIDIAGVEAELTLCKAESPDAAVDGADTLKLAITLDDQPHVLGISDSAEYPDLHLLWRRLAELPPALVIALVEKDAGALLQTVENVVRKELRIVEIVRDVQRRDGAYSFRLATKSASFAFDLDLDSETVACLGVLDCLDVTNESIRSLARTARAEYCALNLDEREVASLKPGDFLVSGDDGSAASWQIELPSDDKIRLCGMDEATFTFAQFADETLPSAPQTQTLAVFRRGVPIASAERSSVGDVPAVKITSVF